MESVDLVCRIALATVLAVAATAKASDLAGTRSAVGNLGAPRSLVPALAVGLPVVEFLLAVALLPAATARIAGLLSVALLMVFSGAVAVSLAHGNRAQCRCFGGLGGSAVSGRTLLRNAALGALAVLPLARPPIGFLEYAGSRPLPATAGTLVSGLILGAAVVAADVFLDRLSGHRHARRTTGALAGARHDEAHARARVVTFDLNDVQGNAVASTALLDGTRPLLVTFLSPGCGPCVALRPAVQRWEHAFRGQLAVVVVAVGTARTALAVETFGPRVLFDEDGSARAALGASGAPSAALLHETGRLTMPPVTGGDAIRQLLAHALSGSKPHDHQGDGAMSPADVVTPASRPWRRPTVTASAATAEGGAAATMLVDELSGASAALDTIGGLIWSCLDGDTTLEEIVADLAEVFATAPDTIRTSVLDLVRDLAARGFVLDAAVSDVRSPAG